VCVPAGPDSAGTAGGASHRCYVANCSGEALPTHGIRRMLLAQEVRALQEPVAGLERSRAAASAGRAPRHRPFPDGRKARLPGPAKIGNSRQSSSGQNFHSGVSLACGSLQDSHPIAGDSIAPEPTGLWQFIDSNWECALVKRPLYVRTGDRFAQPDLESTKYRVTYRSTEFSMSEVADQGSRFRFSFKFRFQRTPG